MIVRRSAATMAVAVGAVLLLSSRAVHAQPPFAGVTVQHVGLAIRDINKAVKDYAEFLGVPVPKVGEVKSLKYPDSYRGDHSAWARIAMIGMGDVLLDLVEPVGGVSPWRTRIDRGGEGLQHICIEVDNVDAAVDELVKRGGKHEMGLRGAVSQYVNMDDTLGITFEVMKRGQMKAAGYDNLPTPTRFAVGSLDHVGVVVRDADKAAKILAETFGIKPPKAGNRMGGKIAYLDTNPIAIEFVEATGKGPWRDYVEKAGPSIHHLGVRVKNMHEQIAYAQKNGGQLLVGPADGRAVVDIKSRPLPFAFELIER